MRRAARSDGRKALAVLQRADAALAGWTCSSDAGCCRFGLTGREPYLTEAEWRLVETEVARQGRRMPRPRADRVCPFLTEKGRCSVYTVRPLGCRTYYCHRASGPRPDRSELASLPHRLEAVSADPSARGRPLTSWMNRKR